MTSPLRRRQQRRFPGVYRGLVVNASDPLGRGRVELTLPGLLGTNTQWASTLRSPCGALQVGDEVLVDFEGGQLDRPFVLGVLEDGAPRTTAISDGYGNSVSLSASGVELTAANEVRINASTIRCSSSTASIDAGMWTFSGVVKSQTLVTESVVASSYTPGVGNQA